MWVEQNIRFLIVPNSNGPTIHAVEGDRYEVRKPRDSWHSVLQPGIAIRNYPTEDRANSESMGEVTGGCALMPELGASESQPHLAR
jgi:hypothetical protein